VLRRLRVPRGTDHFRASAGLINGIILPDEAHCIADERRPDGTASWSSRLAGAVVTEWDDVPNGRLAFSRQWWGQVLPMPVPER
jgi:hypothetical protein